VQSIRDDLYVRVLDPAAALAARRYGTDDELVLELTDPFRPANDGRWLVAGGPQGAACERTSRPPDLALSIVELGSLFLGGVRATPLARAGRLEERTPGALARADAFFGWGVAPWLTNGF
jgi:predicted acetyltransferase